MAYSTAADVRPNFLSNRESQTSKTGTTLTLGRRDAVDIYTLTKNGSALTKVTTTPVTGEFRFVEPNTITLGDAAVSSDVFVITSSIYLTDTEIDVYISDADTLMNSELSTAYSLPFATTPPLIADISKRIAQFFIVRKLTGDTRFRVGEKELDYYEKEFNDAMMWLDEVVSGDRKLLDSSLTEISRLSVAEDDEPYISFESSASEGDCYWDGVV